MWAFVFDFYLCHVTTDLIFFYDHGSEVLVTHKEGSGSNYPVFVLLLARSEKDTWCPLAMLFRWFRVLLYESLDSWSPFLNFTSKSAISNFKNHPLSRLLLSRPSHNRVPGWQNHRINGYYTLFLSLVEYPTAILRGETGSYRDATIS